MIEQPPSDRQLVDAVIAGDPLAFRVLIERESAMVIAACRRVVGNPDEAEDVAQDAFMQAYRALATFRGDGPFGAWLRRIAVRVAVARVATRRDPVSLDVEELDPRLAALHSGDDPQAELLDQEWRTALRDAVERLPAAQRDVVVLRFYEDLSLAEIAEATSHPIGTVKSRLNRGMAGLRDHLAPRTAR